MTKYYSRTKRDKYLQKFVHAYEKGLVIYDTESTGLCVEDDDIIKIAAVIVKVGTIIGKFDIMLKKHEGKKSSVSRRHRKSNGQGLCRFQE